MIIDVAQYKVLQDKPSVITLRLFNVTVIYSECVFLALSSTQRACNILSSLACPDLKYFSTFCHKCEKFREKKNVVEHKMCLDFLYKLCLKHFSF